MMVQLKKEHFLSRHNNSIYALLLFVVVNSMAFFILDSINSIDEDLQEKDRQTHAEDYFRRLELRFDSYVAAAKTLRDRTVHHGGLTQENFEKESQLIQNYFKGFQALNFINTEGTLVWVTPLEGNEKALGKNLFKKELVKELLLAPKAQHELFLSPPLELYQGGKGLVFYFPLVKNNIFKGWINIVFRAQAVLSDILTPEERRSYSLVINDHKTDLLIYSDLTSQEVEGQNVYYYEFKLFDRIWSIGLVENGESVVPTALRWTYAFILLLSIVLAVTFKLYLDRWDEVKANLQDALSEATLLKVLGHDLRSPLTMAELLIEKLERQTQKLPEAQAPLLEIKKLFSVQSEMLESVRDLQLFKRRKKEIFLGPVSLFQSVERVKSLFDYPLQKKNLKISTNLDLENDIQILAHKSYFENNVLINLFSNAIKYSPNGGEIFVEAKEENSHVIIEITDQGRGLTKEMRDKFHRGEPLPSLKGTGGESGSGFGLLLVKNFVGLLGGEVLIKPGSPQGSIFVLTFPKS
jgi:signal transduction histidine kinase